MKNILSLLVICLALTACGQSAHKFSASKSEIAQSSQADKGDVRNKYLAYVHSLTVETDEDGVRTLYEKIMASCNADKESGCTLLDSNLGMGQYVNGNIKIRAKSEGIQNLIRIVGAGGKITEQSTSVEDLTHSIVDSNKRIEMLQQYQKKLIELEHRPNNDVDALIKLTKELATTQSELEQTSGENARLLERVNMDILQISIRADTSRSFWKPIGSAFSEFAGNLSNGISTTITALAYILPWLVILLVFGFIGRKMWRRKKS
jgi:hypothetical protein